MFGLSEATEIFQGSTERTWNCVLHYIQLLWSKISQIGKPIMPKSRKRHHSRSRSKSRSHSRDRSRDRDEKYQKIDSYEKDGKRRKLDSTDSPNHRKSVSSDPECEALPISSDEEMETLQLKEDTMDSVMDVQVKANTKDTESNAKDANRSNKKSDTSDLEVSTVEEGQDITTLDDNKDKHEKKNSNDENTDQEQGDVTINLNESVDSGNNSRTPSTRIKSKLEMTPKTVFSPRQVRKNLESEKKRQERQREKEEKEKKRNEEKMKKKEEKQKELEQKQKEKELKEAQKKEEREKKEEQKRKEREEKEQKRKEKEEKEEQKRKEREMEKLKKQSEMEEKNKEKQKKEVKMQKEAAAFVNFFVAKKSDTIQEKKSDDVNPSPFMAFEIKSDMRLPPPRRKPLSEEDIESFDKEFEKQNVTVSYLADLKCYKNIRTSPKTWPYQEILDDDDDVEIVGDGNLGESICEDNSKLQKFRAKFLKFHENQRPAYYGTWRKKSKCVTGRKPFAEEKDIFNYEEDSDDDWEEEEQGESLNGSDDEEKETEEERDEYEVDNEFFVPHGHLSDDEIDDEEKARLSPESLKQKLKLLKDEFEQDMQSKTHKLKSRSVGCIWYNKDSTNIDEAIDRYLQPFAIIANGPIRIKKRSEIYVITARKSKHSYELHPDYIPLFLKIIHGNPNNKKVLVEQFLTYMANKGIQIDLKKGTLFRILKKFATWKQSKEKGTSKNKFLWLVNKDVEKKFNIDLVLPNFLESDEKK